ncbi:hypothetical protein SO802_022021 [Lithocarpus litseifolius]|uniref:RNase H type-1 domain-containing protein n=1 Tax=Lithocarpus litseifolius TaxID=425828 RepID=A0AAW2CLE0_9ROSI
MVKLREHSHTDGLETTEFGEIHIQILIIGIEEYDDILVLMKFENNWMARLREQSHIDGSETTGLGEIHIEILIIGIEEYAGILVLQLEQAYQPVEVEAITACRAVEFGSEIGVDYAIMEDDPEVIVKALRNKDNGFLFIAPLINDVSLFSGLYSELSYFHIRKNGNKVAHSLARLALITIDCTVWMEDVPFRTLYFV